AVYAADGFARATGSGAAAFTITGPGAANTLGAFGEAASCHSPVVLVAPEVAGRSRGKGSFGRVHGQADHAALLEPSAKGVFRLRDPATVGAAIAQAAQLALTPPTGPVYLDVPHDLLTEPTEPAPALDPAPAPPTAETHELLEALKHSERPIIW